MVVAVGCLGAGRVRSMTLRLIVNADDYGITTATNRGIERAHMHGVVTSTTVMANQNLAAEAAALRARCPDLGIGIHLTLTLGSPLAPVDTVRSLLDADDRLLDRHSLLQRLARGGVVADHVVAECVAQVRALRSMGIEPDHWDAHQHLHEYAGLGRPIIEAMLAEDVMRARNPTRARTARAQLGPRALMQARRRESMATLVRASFKTPDLLFEASPARWGDLIRRLPDGVIEAICHPAEPDHALPPSTIRSAERVAELRALCDGHLRDALAVRGVQLTTFHGALGSDR